MEHPGSPKDNYYWIVREIKNEFKYWMEFDSKRGRFPNNIIFVSNVRLSAIGQVGGVDSIKLFLKTHLDYNYGTEKHPDSLRARGLRSARVWHRDYLNALLSNHQSIRNAFPTLLTTGDILSRIESTQRIPNAEETAAILRAHDQSILRYERWVRFSEAGSSAKRSVEQVIVDLPFQDQATRLRLIKREYAIDAFIRDAQMVRRASVWDKAVPRHLVITGAPGNGKSTIVKFLTQAFRARFLRDEQGPPEVLQLNLETEQALHRLKCGSLKLHRWPFKIDLAAFAAELGPEGGPSLVRLIAAKISDRAHRDVDVSIVQRWLKTWPSVIFFDGLDEVTALDLRARVTEEIRELVDLLDDWDADALIVVTTRPTGYNESILPTHFRQWNLDYFSDQEAIAYGRHITRTRLHDDEELLTRILARFDQAVETRSADRLLKTPLQVLIVTLILERSGTLPTNRYRLFWEYFETIFQREADKSTSLQRFYGEYGDQITELHERVGLVLQVECEQTGDPVARMPLTQLHDMALQRLVDVGFEADTRAKGVADRICEIATKRLVLLGPSEDDSVSFDVRSMQELMAARALTGAEPEKVRRHLAAIARSPHWRNTWLFAAGRLFSEGDFKKDLVLEIVETIDEDPGSIGWLYPAAPELAAHLLEDGLSVNKPAWERRLLDCTLRVLQGPMPEDPRAFGIGLTVAAENSINRIRIRNAFRKAFSGEPQAVAIANLVKSVADLGSDIPGELQSLEVGTPFVTMSDAKVGKAADLLPAIRPELMELLNQSQQEILMKAIEELGSMAYMQVSRSAVVTAGHPIVDVMHASISLMKDPQLCDAFSMYLDGLDPNDWILRANFALRISAQTSRDPVGHDLQFGYLPNQ